MENTKKGFVYILTNPSFKEDLIKIGKSSRFPDIRSKELDNTAIPSEYEIYATLKTEKYNEAERVIHNFVKKLNPDLRIRKNREFFNIKPENAAEILEDVSELLDDSEVEYWSNGKIVVSTEKQKRKVGKRFSIYEKGLKDGDVIKFVVDENITAIVVGEREVEFENEVWKLSPLAYELFRRRNELNTSGAYQGAAYFMFNGVKLKDLSQN